MKTYAEFLAALKDWTRRNGWPIYNATDVFKAAESAGFNRAEIIQHYTKYRMRAAVEVRP